MFGRIRLMGKPSPELPEPPPGFRLLRRLGEGKNGVVFLAKRKYEFDGFLSWFLDPLVLALLDVPRIVALKYLPDDRRAKLERRAFVRMRLGLYPFARIPYPAFPNCVRVYGVHGVPYGIQPAEDETVEGEEVWTIREQFWIEMEYVRGPSLLDVFEKRARPPRWLKGPEGFLRLADNLGYGVGVLHANEILHRDLHLGNVLLLRKKPWVKVTDYGLCQHFGRHGFPADLVDDPRSDTADPGYRDETSEEVTSGPTGRAGGPTESWPHIALPEYRAPEVWRQQYSPLSDLYGVAAILKAVLDYLGLDRTTDPGRRFATVLAQGTAPNPRARPMDLAKLYARLRGDPPDERDALYARYLRGDPAVRECHLELNKWWPGRGHYPDSYDIGMRLLGGEID